MIQGRPKRPPRRPARGSAEAGDAADWGVLPSSSAENEARCSICGGKPPGEGADPLRARNEKFERGRRHDVLDANGEDGLILADRPLDLPRDEARAVARFRQHEDERTRPLEAPDDLVAIGAARPHVARRNPALEASLLEGIRDLLRLLPIGLRVADEGR